MASNLIKNGNFWNGMNGYANNGVTYELKQYDHFFDYCEFKSNGTELARFYTYFNDVAGSGFVAGSTYRIGFWGRSDNSISIYIGCNDNPLTFNLAPEWTWYEAEYIAPLTQAVSIRNIDQTNSVCIAGIWVQDGNDPIVPEISPYIEIVELQNNQVQLDINQIEQGSIAAGLIDYPYSIVKQFSTDGLFFYRLRSRNLFRVPTANREIEILGDISGLEYSFCEFNSEQKMIQWNGWYSDSKHFVRPDTRYVSILVRTSSNGLITPQQFINLGGVLRMSNYPTLSTIIDKNGNSYSKGLNQIFNGNFMNNFSSWSSWGNHSGAVREIVTINNKKWLHIKSIKDPWFGLNQGINGTTTNSPVLMPNCLMRASFTRMVSSDTINQSAIGLECKVYNTDGTTINPRYVMSTNWGQWSIYPTPKRHSWTFTTTPNPSHFWLSLGKFQGSDVVEAWFTDIMVEYIEDGSQPLSDYRPNPADLAGGV